jgi:serine/threonine protein kinase
MQESTGLPPQRPVPERVGRYEVLLPIASGGMATVYFARSQGARGFARDVALKLTHAHLKETQEFAATLLEEAKIASRIRHRNVVSILDVGEDPLGLFLVMEYVEGDSLAGLLRAASMRGESMPPRIAIPIVIDALAGLHAAHELVNDAGEPLKVVHRDFSPQNILVGLDGVGQLADFGIAKAADRTGETATGIVKGKVSYMAPEHAQARPIDRRADVWSAGVVAWEILAGQPLYAHRGITTLLKVISERPPRLRLMNPDVTPAVEEVVWRALEPDLSLRYPTAASFAKELGQAFGGAGALADDEEVAAYVSATAGPKLAMRRSQVKDALELRARMAALAQASISTTNARTPSGQMGTDPSSSSIVMGDPGIPVELGVTALHTYDLRPAESEDDHTLADPQPGDTASHPFEVVAQPELPSGASESVHLPVGAAWMRPLLRRRFRPMETIVLFGGVLALVGVTTAVVMEHQSAPAVATDPGITGAAPANDPPVPSSHASAPSTPQAATSVFASPRPSGPVQVHASTRVSWLKINTRSVLVDPPSTNPTFERLAEDGTGPVTLMATALDGRKRTLTVAPDATAVDVDFPAAPVQVSRQPAPPPPAPTTKKQLPPNPYAP